MAFAQRKAVSFPKRHASFRRLPGNNINQSFTALDHHRESTFSLFADVIREVEDLFVKNDVVAQDKPRSAKLERANTARLKAIDLRLSEAAPPIVGPKDPAMIGRRIQQLPNIRRFIHG